MLRASLLVRVAGGVLRRASHSGWQVTVGVLRATESPLVDVRDGHASCYGAAELERFITRTSAVRARASSHWKQVVHHDVPPPAAAAGLGVTVTVDSAGPGRCSAATTSSLSERWDLAQVQVMQAIQVQKLRPRRLTQGIIRVTSLHATGQLEYSQALRRTPGPGP